MPKMFLIHSQHSKKINVPHSTLGCFSPRQFVPACGGLGRCLLPKTQPWTLMTQTWFPSLDAAAEFRRSMASRRWFRRSGFRRRQRHSTQSQGRKDDVDVSTQYQNHANDAICLSAMLTFKLRGRNQKTTVRHRRRGRLNAVQQWLART